MRSRRLRSLLVAAAILLAGFALSALLGRQKPQEEKSRPAKAALAPRLLTVEIGRVALPLELSGPIEAVRKIELYAEVSGVFRDAARPFREGSSFSKGETLLLLDDGVYRNSVLAEKSRLLNQLTLVLPDLIIDFPEEADKWKAYVAAFSITAPLTPLPAPATDRERNYLAARSIYDTFYTVRSMEETLSKYRIRAPFSGVVTASELNPGTLVRVGQKIGEFSAAGRYELEASLSLRDAALLKPGDRVTLTSRDLEGSIGGRVLRVNRAISSRTQSVSAFIGIDDSRLRDGMFLEGSHEVLFENAQAVPRRLLREGEKLFVTDGSLVSLVPVKVLATSGDKAVVRGLEAGMQVVLDPTPGMHDGMKASELGRP